jgi:CBS domain-containing protein
MQVQDVMTSPAISVHPATTVEEIARLMLDNRISAVPVVGDRHQLLCIVTEHDLFLKEKGAPFSMERLPALFDQWVEPEELPELYQATRHYTAADVMTESVTCIDAEDSLGAVARLMVNRRLKRVPVLHDGHVTGMITRADLVSLLVQERL